MVRRMSLTDLDMSLEDMRLEAVSDEKVGSDVSEPLAVGGRDPIDFFGGDGYDNYNRVCHLAIGGAELPPTESSLFTLTSDEVAGRVAEPAPCAGRL